MPTEQDGGAITRKERADHAECGDDVPSKTCGFRGEGHKPCPNEAVDAVFLRSDHRVNEHGVHIDTEVRVVFVCEEHAHRGSDVPDWEAEVRGKPAPTEGNDGE